MFTPNDRGVQIAVARHSKGCRVALHIHIRERNEVVIGTEILIVLRGRIRFGLYSERPCSAQFVAEKERL